MAPRASLCILLIAAVICPSYPAPPDKKTCAENANSCNNASDCCGNCCVNNKCVPFADGCVSSSIDNPCYLHSCPPNKVCYLATVQCLQSPCLPIPACRADDSDYE